MDLKKYFQERKVKYQISSHRPAFTAQRMAAEEHVSGKYVAKPVIIQADGKYFMCVVPACYRVDLDALRSQLGAGDVELASEKEMAALFTDCELGAEPPLGNIFGMTTLMDKSLLKDEYIMFQSGTHDEAIRIKMNDYQELVHPRVLPFGQPLH